MDDLAKIFSTAVLASQAKPESDPSADLFRLAETPAFAAILNAVRDYSRSEGLNELQAAEQIIATFRKVDAAWSEYVFREGIARIRGNA